MDHGLLTIDSTDITLSQNLKKTQKKLKKVSFYCHRAVTTRSLISIKFNNMVINEYAPTLKQVKPINFLFFRTETTVNELEKFLPIANDLFNEAFENKLRITGPVHWHYFGFSTEAHNTFTLEI